MEKTVPSGRPPGSGFLGVLADAGESLRDGRFRTYWASNALFFVGQGLVLLGSQWLMLTLTNSRALLGALGAIQAGTILLLSPVGGVLADRLPRRNLLIVGRAGFTALMTLMGWLVVTGQVEIWHILLSQAVGGVFIAISQPATQTYVYDLVGRERLMNAIALNSLGTGAFQIAGPSIGGALVGAFGPQGAYFAGAAGYFLGGSALFAIPILGKSQGPPRRFSIVQDVAEGVRYIRRDSLLPWLFLATTITFFCGAVNALRPVFAKDILDVGAGGLGVMGAAFGAGTLTGSLLIASLGGRLKRKGLVMLLSCLIWCIGMAIYSQSRWFSMTLAVEFLMGLSPPVWITTAMTILQVRVPEQLRSRVIAVHFMVLQAASFNQWVTGALADLWGDRQAMLLMGLVPTGIMLVMILFMKRVTLLGTERYPLAPLEAARAG